MKLLTLGAALGILAKAQKCDGYYEFKEAHGKGEGI